MASAHRVILLHGLLRNSWDMYPMARYYEKRGFSVFNYGYPARKYNLVEQARRLHETLQKQSFPEPLNFITHSLGSIIVRQFVQLYGKDYNFHRAVFLGPPNQGAAMARLMMKVPFSQKIYGPVLAELAELNLSEHCGDLQVAVIAGGTKKGRGFSPIIAGNNDGIVSVEETRLAGISDFSIVHLPHPILMFSRNVMQMAEHFILSGSLLPDLQAERDG